MDYEAILERYKQYRAVTFEANNHSLPELLSKENIETAARRIGLWVRGKLVLDHLDQTAVLMDYAIHDCRVNGRNAVERFVAQHPPPARSVQETVLMAMQRAFYSLFQIESVVPRVGVHVHDLFQEQRHFLADVGFSQSAVKGLVVATRVFPFADFLMTGGAALAPDADTMEAIADFRLPIADRKSATGNWQSLPWPELVSDSALPRTSSTQSLPLSTERSGAATINAARLLALGPIAPQPHTPAPAAPARNQMVDH